MAAAAAAVYNERLGWVGHLYHVFPGPIDPLILISNFQLPTSNHADDNNKRYARAGQQCDFQHTSEMISPLTVCDPSQPPARGFEVPPSPTFCPSCFLPVGSQCWIPGCFRHWHFCRLRIGLEQKSRWMTCLCRPGPERTKTEVRFSTS
ncbi:uncharacterized protein HMPREF1120_05060 [Exophiala dermatitidis NIH/UT8656]|uniref:Uncharacterized protein n=1 Tax=Exophiala dermatitidis (strain ATCC 34100 / CBS 525.76 / NIH/UT8656) TaxID=858893 RepID=H6BZE2_EXODN|nr:uncharacterized protein HMPREF1120_05060 [Exophiala dermatitidis NIH/UT8656]EHY57005.1 hypothetical protein HMPREF1120_05060 [Exophiala dermatitidis NIH/UT8656]